ncbi:MAG: hypothetical protein ACR2RL_05135 [Gammaproteobacteria bacterium]
MLAPLSSHAHPVLALALLGVCLCARAEPVCPWKIQPVDVVSETASQLLAITYTGPHPRKKAFYGLALEGTNGQEIEDLEEFARRPFLRLQPPARDSGVERLARTQRFTEVYEVPLSVGERYALFLIASSTLIPTLESLGTRISFDAIRGGSDFFGRAPSPPEICQFILD